MRTFLRTRLLLPASLALLAVAPACDPAPVVSEDAAPRDVAVVVDLAVPPDLAVPDGPPPVTFCDPHACPSGACTDGKCIASPFKPEIRVAACRPSGRPYEVAAGDLSGDGKPDIAVTCDDGVVAILLNDGKGGFLSPARYQVSGAPEGVTIADLNGDGKPEVVIAAWEDKAVDVLVNRGNGSFMQSTKFPIDVSVQAVGSGDFNGDGKMDIIAVGVGGAILTSKGGLKFDVWTSLSFGGHDDWGGTGIAIADFDADGKDDVVIARGTSSWIVYSNLIQKFPIVAYAAAIGDFNGDRRPDVVLAQGTASLKINQGRRSFTDATPPRFSGWALVSEIVDLDLDKKPDLILAHDGLNDKHFLSICRGNGNGVSAEAIFVATRTAAKFMAADFDGNGKVDLVVVDSILRDSSSTPSNTDTSILPGK